MFKIFFLISAIISCTSSRKSSTHMDFPDSTCHMKNIDSEIDFDCLISWDKLRNRIMGTVCNNDSTLRKIKVMHQITNNRLLNVLCM